MPLKQNILAGRLSCFGIANICSDPAVSSPEYYPTSAPIVDAIGEALLSGKHLIILNTSGSL